MGIVGDPRLFADFLPDGLLPDILELIILSWEKFIKPYPDEKEVQITRRFCETLKREKNRRDLPFKIRPELSLSNSTTGKEIGRIDLILDSIRTAREEVYFAIECKRLRVPYSSGIRALSSEYVGEDGMMCFVTGKYGAEGLSGGMMGYVMDGNVSKAIQSVGSTINKKRGSLCLINGLGLQVCNILPSFKDLKETRHQLNKRNFTIYHIFLKV